MEAWNLVEVSDSWTLSLDDSPVIRCIVDQFFSLEVVVQKHLMTIQIINDFVFQMNGKTHTIFVEEPKTFGEVLSILTKPVSNIRIYKTGKIEVHGEEFQIIVEPASAYEAWQITADNGLRIICMPDGDLAIWRPDK